jgi:hypothetical protein
LAREAKAERERRARIINARDELRASEDLRQAADTRNPVSLQLRYLQTLLELGADQNSTVVFRVPLDIVWPFLNSLTRGNAPRLEQRCRGLYGPGPHDNAADQATDAGTVDGSLGHVTSRLADEPVR